MRNLSLVHQFGEEIIAVNKPAGFSTHAVDTDKIGLFEIIKSHLKAAKLSDELYVVHRLDKTTTGVLIFARSKSVAQKLSEDFKNHKLKKRYLFLTHSQKIENEFTIRSEINKTGKEFVSQNCNSDEANAITHFKRIKQNPFFQLWEASPQTGRTHQIRLHARHAGIPILGDSVYGGAPFPHLCLHSAELSISEQEKFTSHPPLFFERMGLLRDSELCQILSAFDRRERLYQFLTHPEICLRLLHNESKDYKIDAFAERLMIYWFAKADPSTLQLEKFQFLEGLLKKQVCIQKMQDRGENPNAKQIWSFTDLKNTWQASENNLLFELRSKQGLSPGLFLDQRNNRSWVQNYSKSKSVLNLFSYTCGFSLAAAKGGAKKIISVDLNKKFLEWGKRNFSINLLDPDKYLFFQMDSILFVEQACKKQEQFDLIICDPPSFSRNGKKIWRIEKDLPMLLKNLKKILKLNGSILCSNNYQKWSDIEFADIVKKVFNENEFEITRAQKGFDFELPNQSCEMKSLFIQRKA